MDCVLTEKYEWPKKEIESFVGFLLPMLEFNPLGRRTAEECLKSSWFLSSKSQSSKEEEEEGEVDDGVGGELKIECGVDS